MLEKHGQSLISRDKIYHNWITTLVPFTSLIHILGNFFLYLKILTVSEIMRDFVLMPKLRARPKYQLSSGSLVVEDYRQQNQWNYTQPHDWAALESFKFNLWA